MLARRIQVTPVTAVAVMVGVCVTVGVCVGVQLGHGVGATNVEVGQPKQGVEVAPGVNVGVCVAVFAGVLVIVGVPV